LRCPDEVREVRWVRDVRCASARGLRPLALVLFLAGCAAESSGPTEIVLEPPAFAEATAGKAAIAVRNVSSEQLARLRGDLTREQWNEVLRVAVAEGGPAMLGDYTLDGSSIRFTPMFPFDPGRPYHVTFAPANLKATVALPASAAQPSTVVSHVYPSTDVVPENQLRLYIHFSAPMGLKGGLDYVSLLDDRGQKVEDPFLPLDTEFWNSDRTRYTVFFDPGRQKRGIMPNQQMGRSLEPGKRYTLVVDREWRDANGLPLEESFRREFTVGPADERSLDVSAWRLTAPASGTRDPLVVRFPEALDHGLLLRALGVWKDGRPLDGEIAIEERETRWRFTPRDAWGAGEHQLMAFGMLEDLAGNRIGRAFEVDQFDRSDRSGEPERTPLPFKPKPHLR
jgi:hypothetical protein